MGGFRRFFLGLYSILSIVAVVFLALTWYGPFTRISAGLMRNWYVWAVLGILIIITLIGLVVQLFRALLSRRAIAVNVGRFDGGKIAVTCDAIASTATNIVEQSSSCRVDDVKVKTKGKNKVRVRMKLAPYSASDIYDGGAALHAALMSGLGNLCGKALDSVSLQFVEPQTADITPPDAIPYTSLPELATGSWEGTASNEDASQAVDSQALELAEPSADAASEEV